ncbi:MAG: ribonuclease III [Pseudomonadota bacterium]
MDRQRWLEQHFGCRLDDDQLLKQAFSHRSMGAHNNERLEFLGDSILGLVISEALYHRFPSADEGQLSRLRVSLVKGVTLARVAREIELGEGLILGAGETHGGGRRRDSILADTLEALFGAITIDKGYEAAKASVLRVFAQRLADLRLEQAEKDPKTRLQEHLQGRGEALPVYELIRESGEEHARVFDVSCSLDIGGIHGEGRGSSRRSAEQLAAAAVLEKLGVNA